MPEIYFDNGATTRVFPEVREIMTEVLDIEYGNPSSMHLKGYHAEQYVNFLSQLLSPL